MEKGKKDETNNDDSKAEGIPIKRPCTFFIKKRGGRKQQRRKVDSDNSSEEESQVVKKDRKIQSGISASSKKEMKSKTKEVDGHLVLSVKSDRSAVSKGPGDMGATSTWNIDATKEELEKTVKKTGVSSAIRPGPMAGSTNVRATVRWDYAPDICKDYKETGYCGFGDTCKFMHDRGDYKMGWQLDREYDAGTYGQRVEVEESSSEDDELPFACFICREPFIDPVVTKCGHYFCAKCALTRYKTNKKCFVCGAGTNGIFNAAKDIMKKQEEQAEQAKNDG